MRKKFIYFVLVPFIILLVVVYLFIDRWVEWGLESAGEKLVGAKVEIDNLNLSLSPIAIQFRRLQVANPKDPWKNIFETGTVRFALNFGQLLRGKFIVETMEVSDVILATKRTTDGSLPPSQQPHQPSDSIGGGSSFSTAASQTLAKATANSPVFNLDLLRKQFNVDSLINVRNLNSTRYIDSLTQQVNKASQQWQSTLTDVEKSKQRLTEIETNIKAIHVDELKSVDRITSAITAVDNAYKGVGEIQQTFRDRQTSITQDVSKLSASVQNIDDVVRSDFTHILSMAHLPDLSLKGIAQLLIGKEMFQKATRYLYWVDFARANITKYSPKPDIEKPRRMQGQNIHFPEERSYPKLWIRKVLISGGTDRAQDSDYISLKGEVHDISNDQRLAGAPLTVALAGTRSGTTSLSFNALFDRRQDVPLDDYRATMKGLKVSDFELGQSNFLPSKMTHAGLNSDVHISVPGNNFESTAGITFYNMNLAFAAAPRTTAERLAQDVLESVKGFDVHLRLWKADKGFDVALSTDLDDQIAARVKNVIGNEIAKLENDLRGKLEKTIADKRQEFEKTFASKKDEINTRLKAYESLVTEKVSMLDGKKKELTDRLQKEQKGKVEDALKGIFKKK